MRQAKRTMLGVLLALGMILGMSLTAYAATETYTKATVTYKVVNGTWSDGSTQDKTEYIDVGSKPTNVPTGMLPASGYPRSLGTWSYMTGSSSSSRTIADPAEATITENTTFTFTFNNTKLEVQSDIVKESTVYAGEIYVNGALQLSYLYSPDVSVSPVVFENLKNALAGTYLQSMVPTIANGEAVVSGFFRYTGTAQQGTAYSADSNIFGGINEDWSSVTAVAGRCFTGRVGAETAGELTMTSGSHMDEDGVLITGKLFDNGVFYSTLSVSMSTDWKSVDDVMVKVTTATLHDEGTTIVYTTTTVDTATLSPAEIVTPPAVKTGLVYSGQPQVLVTAGAAMGGTMYYALGTATEATEQYTTSVPAATNAGIYYVWYKAKGDENHSDTAPACIPVTIGADNSNNGSQPSIEAQPTPAPIPTVTQEPITIAKAPASVKAKAKKNKVTVSWKKIKKNKKTKALRAQIKAIEVQYATDPSFTQNVGSKTVGKSKTKAVLKLQKKTTYYVRVRYVGADGVSNWSKTKRVKTK